MTQKNYLGFALLSLIVVLLFSVSMRISQIQALPEPDVQETLSTAETLVSGPPESAQPEQTPEPSAPVDPDLPDVDTIDETCLLVNEVIPLAQSYTPNVVEIADGQYFEENTAQYLNAMLAAANEAGYQTYISCGYRGYSSQAYLFYGRASIIAESGEVPYEQAEVLAREIVAYPGTSEHQLGTAADILDDASTPLSAADTEELPLFEWLRENCAEYGFIERYPRDKQDITGRYEPWHFRYVGEEAAGYIMEKGLCLEEFLELY